MIFNFTEEDKVQVTGNEHLGKDDCKTCWKKAGLPVEPLQKLANELLNNGDK